MQDVKKNMKISKTRNKIWHTGSDRAFIILDVILMALLFLIMVYPLLYVVASSFSGGKVLSGLSLIPQRFSLDGYTSVFQYPYTWGSIWNSVLYTAVGTAMAMVVTILCAYGLSQNFPFGKVCMTLCLITMYFGGGLIPTYLQIKSIGLLNKSYTMIFLGGFSIYNMIITRVYFESSIPNELYESAYMDGADEFTCFFRIGLPLSKAIVSVIALYYSVAHWNGYFSALIYLSKAQYYPLQLVLRNILLLNQGALSMIGDLTEEEIAFASEAAYRTETMKYALIFISSAPLLAAYPFVQKYFVKGVMVGSLKG